MDAEFLQSVGRRESVSWLRMVQSNNDGLLCMVIWTSIVHGFLMDVEVVWTFVYILLCRQTVE